MARKAPPSVGWLPPELLHHLFLEGLTPVWRSKGGGWIWHAGEGWTWRDEGGYVVISRRRLLTVFQHYCAEAGVDETHWIEQGAPPEPLTTGEHRSLDILLRQPGKVGKEDARRLIGGGTERFRKIWRCFPEERKLNAGRPEGYRLPDASLQLLRLRKK